MAEPLIERWTLAVGCNGRWLTSGATLAASGDTCRMMNESALTRCIDRPAASGMEVSGAALTEAVGVNWLGSETDRADETVGDECSLRWTAVPAISGPVLLEAAWLSDAGGALSTAALLGTGSFMTDFVSLDSVRRIEGASGSLNPKDGLPSDASTALETERSELVDGPGGVAPPLPISAC